MYHGEVTCTPWAFTARAKPDKRYVRTANSNRSSLAATAITVLILAAHLADDLRCSATRFNGTETVHLTFCLLFRPTLKCTCGFGKWTGGGVVPQHFTSNLITLILRLTVTAGAWVEPYGCAFLRLHFFGKRLASDTAFSKAHTIHHVTAWCRN